MFRSRTTPRRVRTVHTPRRYAVLLNARAKGWTGNIHEKVQRFVPTRDLYLSDDFRQAERTVDKLLAEDYEAIFTGGGDGTICYLVSAIDERIRRGDITREEAPPVGVLRMGTGNAIAAFLGANSATNDLRALSAGAPLAVYSVDMLRGPQGLYPFAGVGWDAQVLNDYEWLKESVQETAIENYATGLGGYFASVFGRTIPRALRQKPVNVRITNTAEVAFRIDQDGQVLGEHGPGDLLFEGDIQVCAASTIPYWGFKLRMFPHAASRAGFAELRCFDGTAGWIVTHLHKFWRGRFRTEDIANFLIESVHVEVNGRSMPYQVAGDGIGYERSVEWAVDDHPVRLAVPVR